MERYQKKSSNGKQSLLETPTKHYGTDLVSNEDKTEKPSNINTHEADAKLINEPLPLNGFLIFKLVCLSLSVIVLVSHLYINLYL